jgi:hypothetical protein
VKLVYSLARVQERDEWHKLFIEDFKEGEVYPRIAALEKVLTRCTGDYMVKKMKTRRCSENQLRMGVLIADDEDFMLVKLAFKLFESEIKGKRNWAKHHPFDTWRSNEYMAYSTRDPRPMSPLD